jgi:hypothetical protein
LNSQQERFVRNEWLFREVNERIAEVNEDFSVDESIEFLCECGRSNCLEVIRLSRAEYETVRAEGDRFAVRAGHQDPTLERVIERYEEFVVVAKIGEAGDESEERDPRS